MSYYKCEFIQYTEDYTKVININDIHTIDINDENIDFSLHIIYKDNKSYVNFHIFPFYSSNCEEFQSKINKGKRCVLYMNDREDECIIYDHAKAIVTVHVMIGAQKIVLDIPYKLCKDALKLFLMTIF